MVISLQLLFLYVLECKECIITGIYHIMHLYGRAAFREYKRRKNEKWTIAGCCIVSFFVLFVFKYFNFFVDSINGLLNMAGGGRPIGLRLNLLLPIGISYYTFQAVGYVIDVYRGEKAEHNLIKYAADRKSVV